MLKKKTHGKISKIKRVDESCLLVLGLQKARERFNEPEVKRETEDNQAMINNVCETEEDFI